MCDSGKFKQGAGTGFCLKCPLDDQGRNQTSRPGSSSLDDCNPKCAAGSFGPDGGPCDLCPAGKFKGQAGTAPCVQTCPLNTQSAPGSTSKFDCQCVPVSQYAKLLTSITAVLLFYVEYICAVPVASSMHNLRRAYITCKYFFYGE